VVLVPWAAERLVAEPARGGSDPREGMYSCLIHELCSSADHSRTVFDVEPTSVWKLTISFPVNAPTGTAVAHLLQPKFFPDLRELVLIFEGVTIDDEVGAVVTTLTIPTWAASRLERIHVCLRRVKNTGPFYALVESLKKTVTDRPGLVTMSVEL
jgi:hypothetical protein